MKKLVLALLLVSSAAWACPGHHDGDSDNAPQTPKTAEKDKTPAPAKDAPKAEAPKKDAPKAEAPKTDTAKAKDTKAQPKKPDKVSQK